MASFNAFLYFNPDKKSELAILVPSLSVCAASEISISSKIFGIGIPKCLQNHNLFDLRKELP